MRRRTRTWPAWLFVALPAAAVAGPPYVTDDAEPTDPGHWEIYAYAARTGA
ncbi:MAG TPA: hypothetical protein VME40_18335 [Caulobacteraceae bacterium]|nr:hypothetical protein [Caulobacteraceae bacterium]